MNEYLIRELTDRPDALFPLLDCSGMGVIRFKEAYLYVLRGETGWFLMSHQPGDNVFVKKFLTCDGALRSAVAGAERVFHVDGRLHHDLYILISALERELLVHESNLSAEQQRGVEACRAQSGVI